MAQTLQEFTHALEEKHLPRVLHIQSGIYYQGCVYEVFGQECSLSTGDLLKVTEITISRFNALTSSSTEIQLPVEYPGLFKLMADSQPYRSIQEIADSLKIGPQRVAQPVFLSAVDVDLEPGLVLRRRDSFRITAVEWSCGRVHCELLHREPPICFSLSFCQQGPFSECQDHQCYTLKEIADWKIPRGRKRSVVEVKAPAKKNFLFSGLLENVCGELLLTPVYELKAISRLSEKVLLIPSNLDVEVVDVTEQYDCDSFVQPLSLMDVYKRPPQFFPVLAKLSSENHFRLSPDLESLFQSKEVIIHHPFKAKRILASEMCQESARHFLIPESYNGRFKRRPRQFSTAYDLERARSETEEIRVVATKDFETVYSGLASVQAGEEFIVTKGQSCAVSHNGTEKVADTFECVKVKAEGKEPVRLPMCLEGGFMELVKDKRQYTIAEICRWFPLPFNVKVSVRDLSLKADILAGTPSLHIEEEISDPCVLVSNTDLSDFREVPVNRTDLIFNVKQRWDGESPKFSVKSAIEEISEDCYYTIRRYAIATITPPPRPPKKPKDPPPRPPKTSRSESTNSESSSCSPKTLHVEPFKQDGLLQCCDSRNGNEQKIPISPVTLPRPSLQKARAKGRSLDDISMDKHAASDNDVHDYEYIDEEQLDNIRRTYQEQQINTKAKPSHTI
ncbi:protein THEMIS [Danio rerio]|uniref:Protein THEMIS n=1 Tax=Danio rerio TaxID=7955 RepID=THMS1_DANRE|nr:protein THEMIS [Danio rerio]A5PF62.1 RecName: Full=Protein THEMIS; AltName: Full=Thymocyte-expressed molecule involved in selection [Danio rerio]|eukprot:NP_001333171.1 protein THEMIS [Danio rerio]